jgi:FkbM family methyltransferase
MSSAQQVDLKTGRGKRRRSGDWFEVAVVALTTAVLTGFAMRDYYARHVDQRLLQSEFYAAGAMTELEPISAGYGPAHHSRNFEEWCIRDFFKDRRNGVFVDVGANHYKNENNTYFLETTLGWSGVAIDALAEFGPDYQRHRQKTRFAALFVSDVAGATVPFFVPKDNTLVASYSRDFTVQEGHPGVARDVPTTTLNVVLDQAGIPKVDFLSMDIELAEPKALAGFDIDRFRPALVCIESHVEVRQQILDYFAKHHYTVVAKYLRIDPHNLYFQRLDG